MRAVPLLLIALVLSGCFGQMQDRQPPPPAGPAPDVATGKEWAQAMEVTSFAGAALAADAEGVAVATLKSPGTLRLARFDPDGRLLSHTWHNLTGGERWWASAPALARSGDGGYLVAARTLLPGPEPRYRVDVIELDRAGHYLRHAATPAPAGLGVVGIEISPGISLVRTGAGAVVLSSFHTTVPEYVTYATTYSESAGTLSPLARAAPGVVLAASVTRSGLIDALVLEKNFTDQRVVHHVLTATGTPHETLPRHIMGNVPLTWTLPQSAVRTGDRAYVLYAPDEAGRAVTAITGTGEAWTTDLPILDGAPALLAAGPDSAVVLTAPETPANRSATARVWVVDDSGRLARTREYDLLGPRPLALAPLAGGDVYVLLAAGSRRVVTPEQQAIPEVEELVLLRLAPAPANG